MAIQRDKLERSLGGIAEMTKIPDMIFVIDTNVEDLAVKEALKLNIPIVAILDTNSNPVGINYPIPGNDDARRAINLYCDLVKQTVLDAQTNIQKPDPKDIKKTEQRDIKTEKSEEKIKKEIKKESPKKELQKKKTKVKTVKKISKSIISKVKSLTSKKNKS